MKKLLPLLGLLATISCADSGQTQSLPETQQLKVATWNIAWLDTTPTRSDQERSVEDYEKLMFYANELDADVIGFQEVADKNSIDRVLGKGKYNIIISSRNNAQRTGFAIRKGIEYRDMGEYSKLGLDGSVRYGMDVMVNAGSSSIRLLNVHLKSFCFGKEEESRTDRIDDCEKHNSQVSILDEWIQARENEEVAYGILGDFNRKLKRTDDNNTEIITKEDNKTVLTFVGHEDASKCLSKNRKGKLISYSEFIEHLGLSNKALTFYEPGSFTHHPYSTSDVKQYKLSDHCPISVTLNM